MLYYLHIPKSAGTSVRILFGRLYRRDLVEVYGNIDDEYARSLVTRCHKDSVLFGHYSFSLHLLLGDDQPEYMTLLRNPIDRVISWYKSTVNNPKADHFARIQRDRLTIAEAVQLGFASEANNHSVRILSGNYRNWTEKYQALDRLSRLRGKESYQFNGKRYLDAAVANLNHYFCFVGTVDNLDPLAHFLNRRCGLPAEGMVISRANVTPPIEVPLDSQTLAVIEKANELDLLLYEKVAAKWRAGEPWYPVEVRPRTMMSRLNVARLAIPPNGAVVDRFQTLPKDAPAPQIPAPRAHEAELLKPILIECCGRSGGTALISLLGTDPRVALDRAYRQLENRYLTYFAKFVLLLMRRELVPSFAYDDLYLFNNSSFGPLPWSGAHSTMASTASSLPDRHAPWLRNIWETFGAEVMQSNPDARFYAEKTPCWVPPLVRDVLQTTTIHLVRDPRDNFISANAFMRKRNYQSFAREQGDTDLDHARRLTRAFLEHFENYLMARGREDYLLMRYDDLILHQDAVKQRLEQQLPLRLDWQGLGRMDAHITAADPERSLNRWRREAIPPEVCTFFEKYLQSEMKYCGFDPGSSPQVEEFRSVEFRTGAIDLAKLRCSGDGSTELKEEFAEVTVRGPDYWMILPLPAFDAAAVHDVWISLNGMIGDVCSLYWRGPAEDFSEERAIHLNYWPGLQWQVLRVRTDHPLWAGTIAELRLDIFNIRGLGIAGHGRIRWVRLVE